MIISSFNTFQYFYVHDTVCLVEVSLFMIILADVIWAIGLDFKFRTSILKNVMITGIIWYLFPFCGFVLDENLTWLLLDRK